MALEKHRENYRILQASTPDGLAYKVHAATHNGEWEIAGGVAAVRLINTNMFYQAITKTKVPE